MTEWTKEQEKIIHGLKNLLAVIHRDGGHYTEEHGIEKSIKEARNKVRHLQMVLDGNLKPT